MKAGLAAWLVFSAFIVYGGTIPFRFVDNTAAIGRRLADLPLNPLMSPETGRRLSMPDVAQNTLLFIPFGILGVWAGAAGSRLTLRRVAVVTASGLALSVIVEALQLCTVDRVASVADVLTNTLGAGLGAFAAWRFGPLVLTGLRAVRDRGFSDTPELRTFLVAAAALCVAAWQPFNFTLDVSTTVAKVRTLESDAWQFAGLHGEGVSIILAAFVTTTLASYLSVIGERHAGRLAAAIAFGFVLLLEASQLIIESRMPGAWDVLVSAAGIAIGSVLWASSGRIIWPGLWLGLLVAATFAAAAALTLGRPTIADAYQGVSWFPPMSFRGRRMFTTLGHFVELLLLYFPLGFWLGGSPAGRRALAACAALTIGIALPVEYVEGWIAGGHPNVADLAFSLIGACLGWYAAQRIAAYNGRAL